MVLPGKRPPCLGLAWLCLLGAISDGWGLACPLSCRLSAWLEGGSVKEPNRQSADRDDAQEDEDEGDVRLTLGVVLGETVHQQAAGREQGLTAALLRLVELRGIEPLTS